MTGSPVSSNILSPHATLPWLATVRPWGLGISVFPFLSRLGQPMHSSAAMSWQTKPCLLPCHACWPDQEGDAADLIAPSSATELEGFTAKFIMQRGSNLKIRVGTCLWQTPAGLFSYIKLRAKLHVIWALRLKCRVGDLPGQLAHGKVDAQALLHWLIYPANVQL